MAAPFESGQGDGAEGTRTRVQVRPGFNITQERAEPRMSSNPFADLAAQSTVPAGPIADSDSWFGTADDYGPGGTFTPRPNLDYLHGRAAIMIPRQQIDVPDMNDRAKTKKVWDVDLYVVNGGPLSFEYVERESGQPEAIKIFTHEGDVTPDNPFVVKDFRVFQGYINYKLTRASRDRRMFIGVFARVPQKDQAAQGMTAEDVEKAYQLWVDRGRRKPEAKYAWDMVTPTPEEMAAIQAGWEANKDKIAL